MPYTVEGLCERGIEPTMLLLLDRVQKRATATYGEIARMLQRELNLGEGKVFPTHIGAVAGHLMDRILAKRRNAPLINALVVAQDDGLPGRGCYGFIDRRSDWSKGTTEAMPRAKRVALIHETWEEAFDYGKWEAVFENVFDHAPKSADEAGLQTFTERDGRPGGWGGRGGGESDQHKRLKRHVLANPDCIGIRRSDVQLKTTEQPLLSGDSVDVLISARGVSHLVEVKSILSSDDDLKRGIYQCLKYRTVLAAQQEKDFATSDIDAALVTERDLPTDLIDLAKRLGIKTYRVRVNI